MSYTVTANRAPGAKLTATRRPTASLLNLHALVLCRMSTATELIYSHKPYSHQLKISATMTAENRPSGGAGLTSRHGEISGGSTSAGSRTAELEQLSQLPGAHPTSHAHDIHDIHTFT